MDSEYRVPGTKFRFGLDPIVGLIPGFGNVATSLVSCALVWTMMRHGASGNVTARMALNIAIDSLVGAIPIVGAIGDGGWRFIVLSGLRESDPDAAPTTLSLTLRPGLRVAGRVHRQELDRPIPDSLRVRAYCQSMELRAEMWWLLRGISKTGPWNRDAAIDFADLLDTDVHCLLARFPLEADVVDGRFSIALPKVPGSFDLAVIDPDDGESTLAQASLEIEDGDERTAVELDLAIHAKR